MRLKTHFRLVASRIADVGTFILSLGMNESRRSIREGLKRREEDVAALSQIFLDHARFCAQDKKALFIERLGRTTGYASAVRNQQIYQVDACRVESVWDLVELAKKDPKGFKRRLYQAVDTPRGKKTDIDHALAYAMKERASIEKALLEMRAIYRVDAFYRPK